MFTRIALFLGSLFSLLTLSGVQGELTTLSTNAFRANISLVQVGHPFTVSCTLADYSPSLTFSHGHSPYTVVFYRNEGTLIAVYEFPSVANLTTRRHPSITLNPDQIGDIQLTSLSTNSTSVSLSILPKSVSASEYWCKYASNSSVIFESNSLPISVVESLPQVSLLPDSAKFRLNEPYFFTCALTSLNLTADRLDSIYVSFYSKRDGLLLRYDYNEGRLLAFIRKHANLTIHQGHFDTIYRVESHFPFFYMTLTVASDLNQEFWCSLEAPHLPTFESNHWKGDSFANFISVKPDPTTRWGVCELSAFQPGEEEYAVKFQSDHGPEAVNRLGTYTVKPNQTIEFDAEEVPGWTEIIYSALPKFPTFVITAKGNALNGSWWCILAVGRKGTANYVEYSSSKLELS